MGAIWSEQVLSTRFGRELGPGALPGLRFLRSLATPDEVIKIGGQGG